MARGFYSVVQYCPDRFRAEAVNVGLVLLRLEPDALRMRMADNHDRVRRLFAINQRDSTNLKMFTDNMTFRIKNSAEELRTRDDLAAFAASLANDLRLTQPRLAIIENFDADFERLFSQLVEEPAISAATEVG